MTPDEKSRMTALRKAGRSSAAIAGELGISKNTVKTFCRRNGLTAEAERAPVTETLEQRESRLCPHCGKPVIQIYPIDGVRKEGRTMTKKAIAHELRNIRYELDWLQRREQQHNPDWRFRSLPYSKRRARLVKI